MHRNVGSERRRAVFGPGGRAELGAAWITAEKLVVFVRDILPFIGISGIGLFARNIGPGRSVLTVEFEPAFGRGLAIRNDCFDRTLRFAHPAIDAFIGVNNQHVFTLIETVYGADLYTIHVFTTDAGLCDNVGHVVGSSC